MIYSLKQADAEVGIAVNDAETVKNHNQFIASPVPPVELHESKSQSITKDAKMNNRIGSRSTPETQDPFDSDLPDHIYVVFCRICGIKGKIFDQLSDKEFAACFFVLCNAVDEINTNQYHNVRSNFHGLFLEMKTAGSAMNTAVAVRDQLVSNGVDIAIGIAAGKPGVFPDLHSSNVTGEAINIAARLAFIYKRPNEARGWIAVDVLYEDVVAAIVREGDYDNGSFDKRTRVKVKQTNLEYCLHIDRSAARSILAFPVKSFQPVQSYTIVYDAQGFSGMEPAKQNETAGKLSKKVKKVLDLLGQTALLDQEKLWFSPGGDGGALVYLAVNDAGDRAWKAADDINKFVEGHIPVRIGIVKGTVIVLRDRFPNATVPVGTGILRADDLCTKAKIESPVVDREFWKDRTPELKAGWTELEIESDQTVWMLANRQAEDSGRDVVGGGESERQECHRAGKDRSGEDADIYKNVISEIENLLTKNKALRTTLRKLTPDLLEGAEDGSWRLSANTRSDRFDPTDALDKIERGIKDNPSVNKFCEQDWLDLKCLVGGIIVLGIDPNWVKENKGQLIAGAVAVPRCDTHEGFGDGKKAKFLPIIIAALSEAQCRLESVFASSENPGRDIVYNQEIHSGTLACDIEKAVMVHLIKCVFPGEHSSDEFAADDFVVERFKDVRAKMYRERHKMKNPYFNFQNTQSRSAINTDVMIDIFKTKLMLHDLYLIYSEPNPVGLMKGRISVLSDLHSIFETIKNQTGV